jgi:hypothetical protein
MIAPPNYKGFGLSFDSSSTVMAPALDWLGIAFQLRFQWATKQIPMSLCNCVTFLQHQIAPPK